jgi:NAD(P)H-dependent FMN reductase
MSNPVRILGIAGSLRRGSYNRAALRAATQLVPQDAALEVFELDGIPGFNQDEEQNPPAKVAELKQRVRNADAILIVTPEYNYSVPGVLKNAIDWASRPLRRQRLERKAGCDHGGFDRNDWHRAGAISSSPNVRLPKYVPDQPTGGDDRQRRGAF